MTLNCSVQIQFWFQNTPFYIIISKYKALSIYSKRIHRVIKRKNKKRKVLMNICHKVTIKKGKIADSYFYNQIQRIKFLMICTIWLISPHP